MLIVPYRYPLLIARMAATLTDLSGGRLAPGDGVAGAGHRSRALEAARRHRYRTELR
jgi:alkanesulfonate monooxygenase SsuD/methylene tetrahydromethanopterin reductase-like flavin-dependent oxidoreductase (luciferase family)